jgi:molecular chaperone GrpE
MSEPNDKGAFQADIPADAVQEALRSVERIARGDTPGAPATAGERGSGGEAPGSDEGEAGGSRATASESAEGAAAALRAQLELSTAKGRETLDRLKEEHERFLRAAADLENYRKRAAKEREEIQKFGNERLLRDIFPVADNLDRALAAAPADDPLADGVKLVRASLEQALAKHGVVGFSALGEKFDPALHEALMQVPTREKPPGTVVLEHARGFKLHDRLVRPAMVGVAVEPPDDAGTPAKG